MRHKNKMTLLVFVLLTMLALLCGCSNQNQETELGIQSDKIRIVCATFPEYDWVKAVIGEEQEKYDITLLVDNGTDLHSFQPNAGDIVKIGTSDIFIYTGGESDGWVTDLLAVTPNENRIVVNMMESLGEHIKEEELVEGMQGEKETHNHVDEEDPEYDEHIWLSVRNASILVDTITEAIKEKDPEHMAEYEQNKAAYQEKLKQIDEEYKQMVADAKIRTIVVGDRFPFRYMVDDYDIQYYAAFVGCSAESEASFETITFLAGKVDQLHLHTILTIENSDQKIAKTIQENTKKKNQTILALDSMQAVTRTEIDGGYTYLQAMEYNLDILRKALN